MKEVTQKLWARAQDIWTNIAKPALIIAALVVCVIVGLLVVQCGNLGVPAPAPITPVTMTPTKAPTATEQPTHIPSPTLTFTATATHTASPTRTATHTPVPTHTPTPSAVPTLPTITAGRDLITPPATLPDTGGQFEQGVNHLDAGMGALVVCDRGAPFAFVKGTAILIGCQGEGQVLPFAEPD